MSILGELRGKGRLTASDAEAFEVEYEITVRQSGGIKGGDGWIFSDEMNLFDMFRRKNLELILRDGQAVTIVMTRTSGNNANFKTSGPVPGF